MKSEFKTKLIQHILNKKNGEKGFTLIELLVVIIIIGILAAIALPSFLNQAAKARQSEAKTYVGSVNRSQQAYYLEKQSFANSFSTLSLGINTSTENYTYGVTGNTDKTLTTTNNNAFATSVPKNPTLKSYAGIVNLATLTGTGEATTVSALFEAVKAPSSAGTGTPTLATFFLLTTNAIPVSTNSTADTGFAPIQ